MISILAAMVLAIPAAAEEPTPHQSIKALWDKGVVVEASETMGWFAGRGSWSSDPKNVYGALVVGFMAENEPRLLPLTFPQADFYDRLDPRKIDAVRQDMAANQKILPKPEKKDGSLSITFSTVDEVCASKTPEPLKNCLVTTLYELRRASKSFVAKVTSPQMNDVVYLYYYKEVTPQAASGRPKTGELPL